MTCPRCQIEYNSRHWGECPHCGISGEVAPGNGAVRQLEGVVKTSTILISTRDGSGIFSSIDEVPESLRETLVACTTGINAATIIIADQGGRARIAHALSALPADSPSRPGPSLVLRPQSYDRLRGRVPVMIWAGLLVAGCSGALVWLLISHLS